MQQRQQQSLWINKNSANLAGEEHRMDPALSWEGSIAIEMPNRTVIIMIVNK